MKFTLGSLILLSISHLGLATPVVIKPINTTISPPVHKSDDLEDAHLTITELATKYGYPMETHQVQTDDGYILTLHRIPYGKKWGIDQPRKSSPVLCMHGLLASSFDYVLMGPDNSLGFILADNGYDVWFGNSRGNVYSRDHTQMDTTNPDFWDFSWHEMGIYDLPAIIKYMLHVTEKEDILYIGHSQGTTQYLVCASENKPECNDLVKAAVLLAPVFDMASIKNYLFVFLASLSGGLSAIAKLLGLYEIAPDAGAQFVNMICPDDETREKNQAFCTNLLYQLTGANLEELNPNAVEIVTEHPSAGAALKQVVHYAQCINHGFCRQFDYGMILNLWNYGSISPPDYDLNNIKSPIILLNGEMDELADPTDVHTLYRKLSSIEGIFTVPDPNFCHTCFLYGEKNDLVNDRVVSLINRF